MNMRKVYVIDCSIFSLKQQKLGTGFKAMRSQWSINQQTNLLFCYMYICEWETAVQIFL